MATTLPLSIDEFGQLPDTGVRTKLVDGAVIELPGRTLLQSFVRDEIRAALRAMAPGWPGVEAEFRTTAERVRRADVIWFGLGRLVEADWARCIMPTPDLVVDVISQTDRIGDIRKKVQDCLDAGVTTVWLIYTESREADIWNRGHRTAVAGVNTLTADCLPGFSLPVANLFPARISA